jgi:Amt family ammonium transporter
LGVLLVGFWATKAINPAGANGLFHGEARQVLLQFIMLVGCGIYSFVLSWILLKLVDKVIGLRVPGDHENIGLDLTQHSESAYTLVG